MSKDQDPAAKKPSVLANFATAGAGGILGWIVVHPANTVATRMNLLARARDGPKAPSFVKFSTTLVKEEGFLALYKGLSAGIARQVIYASSRFGLFEVMRDEVAKYRKTDLITRLLVGVVSGGCAAFISCPAEVSLVRMSNDQGLPVDQRRNYTSVINAGVRIAREEGFLTFWRGSMPFVNRAMLVGACQVGTYDQFKESFANLGVKANTLPNTFCASFSAGLLYSLVTMPFESIKNRMAFQRALPDGTLLYKSTLQSLSMVAREEGVLSLWRGFFPYYLRCGGHTVSMFIAVEQLRKLL